MQSRIETLLMLGKVKKLFLTLLLFAFSLNSLPCFGKSDSEPEYQLYKNYENYGIVVFPKDILFARLNEFIESIGFDLVESGKAAMRFGSKGENSTYMMPLKIQKKHRIEKFIVLQVMPDQKKFMVGVYDPDWGLTLPNTLFLLEQVKKNIPKTLKAFRGKVQKREAFWESPGTNCRSFISWPLIQGQLFTVRDWPICNKRQGGEYFHAYL